MADLDEILISFIEPKKACIHQSFIIIIINVHIWTKSLHK